MLFIAQIFVLGLLLSRCEAESVLMRAVAADDVDQLKALVEDNNDINSIGDGGQTPLMRACLTGKVAALRWLLAAGADMQIGEKDGYICPHGVGYQGRFEAVKVLFEHGGLDILLHKHQDGFTAIHRACWGSEARHTETVRQMLKVGVPFDLRAADGTTPLRMVRSNEGTRKLLERWAKKQAEKEVAPKDEV